MGKGCEQHARSVQRFQYMFLGYWNSCQCFTTVKYYSPTTSLCIIRVAREHVRTAWTGLTFVNNIGGQPVIPRVVAVSGMLSVVDTRRSC